METELFSWTSWDGEPDCMCFYNPVLKIRIGEYEPGTKFDCAFILQHTTNHLGVLQLFNKIDAERGVPTAEYKLHYVVGEKINT